MDNSIVYRGDAMKINVQSNSNYHNRIDVVKCPYRYKYELIAWVRTYTNIPIKKIRRMSKKQLYAIFYSY